MTRFLIPACNVSRLQRSIDAVERRCKKYGNPFSYKWGGVQYIIHLDEEGREYRLAHIELDIEGTVEAESGWEFVAAIDHTPEGNIIRQWDLSLEIPTKYRTVGPVCEHCGSNRHRVQTCLLYRRETDEWKQVGTSCVQEFTGGLSGEHVAALASFLATAASNEDLDKDFALATSTDHHYFPIYPILAAAEECINKFGYQNSQSRYPTGSRAFKYYEYFYRLGCEGDDDLIQEIKDHDIIVDRDENWAKVTGATEWVSHVEDPDDYLFKLQVIVKSGYVKYSEVNLLVSLMITYKRHLEKVARDAEREAKRAAEMVSEYQGKVGERLTIDVASAELVTSWDGYYGWTGLYKFIDNDGNVYMWYSSSGQRTDGATSITGTVKEHSEYRGVKQTVLTRCKIAYAA